MGKQTVPNANLRVMTFNLLSSTKKQRSHPWRLRKRNIARIFTSLKPDVVGTQEANYRQLRELADLLPEYDFFGEGNLGPDMAHSDKNWYCATFFRRDRVRLLDPIGEGDTHWLSPTPEVPASSYNLGTRPRLVTWNQFELVGTQQKFLFGTTHLEAANPWHRKRSAMQLREYVSAKVAQLGPDIPIFLTGDFNAVAGSPEIRAMAAAHPELEPMYDAWAEACRGDCPEGATFRGLGLRDMVGRKLMGPRRIDYVFFRPRPMVRSVTRIDFTDMEHRQQALPSDHYPVVAEFALA